MKTAGYANEELFHAPGHGWFRTKEEALKHVPDDQIEHFSKLQENGWPDELIAKNEKSQTADRPGAC